MGRVDDYYQIDVFDLATGKRVGYRDFKISFYEHLGYKHGGQPSALIFWKDRIYQPEAIKAAQRYGINLSDLDALHEIRKNTDVDPAPSLYVKRAYRRSSEWGWQNISYALMGAMIFISNKEGAYDLSIDPEQGLANRMYYERRYGAVRQKGWYLRLYPQVYEQLGRVNINGLILDFKRGKFSFASEDDQEVATALDVFVDSIRPLDDESLAKIDDETNSIRMLDEHALSFLKALSSLLEGDARAALRNWVEFGFETQGREPIVIPLALSQIPKNWQEKALLLESKGIIGLANLADDLTNLLPPLGRSEPSEMDASLRAQRDFGSSA